MINAAQIYKRTSMQTASKTDLTLMLYEGGIKFCNIALSAIEKNEVSMANENIQKAEKVILELKCSLDFKYPVAKDFDLIYDYVYRRLVEANLRKEKEPLEEALNQIRDMRDMWIEITKKVKNN